MNKIEKGIHNRLNILFDKLGYIQEEKGILYYKNDTPFGFDRIGISIKYFCGEFQGYFSYSKRFNLIENPIWKYSKELRINRIQNDEVTIICGMNFINDSIKASLNNNFMISIDNNYEGITSFCDLLEYNITNKIIPISINFNDLTCLENRIRATLKDYQEFSDEALDNDLLRYLNRQDFRFRIPIIAKLAKVNDFDHVGESMIKEMKRLVNIDKKYQYMLDVMCNLLNDLR